MMLLRFLWPSRRHEINFFITLKPYATRTDTYRQSCLSDIEKDRNYAAPKTLQLEKEFFCSRNTMYLLASTISTKGGISAMPGTQPIEQICTSPPGLRVSQHMPRLPLAYVYRGVLARKQGRLELSKLKQV